MKNDLIDRKELLKALRGIKDEMGYVNKGEIVKLINGISTNTDEVLFCPYCGKNVQEH